MKQAYVNGEPISKEAVQFELDRLVKFYSEHGMRPDEIKANLPKLVEKAQEQAIGAKLLLSRALQLDKPVDEKAVADALLDFCHRDTHCFDQGIAEEKKKYAWANMTAAVMEK